MRRYALAGVPLFIFLGFAVAVGNMLYHEAADGYSPATLPSALIGHRHPSVNLPPLAGLGKPGLTDSGLAGSLTVVNIFASWCIPCRQEHPTLMKLAQDRRVKLVAINYKDDPRQSLAFLGKNGNPFAAVGIDLDGRNSIDWGVYGVPETFVIDPSGRIVARHVGPLDENSLLREIVPAVVAAMTSE
ncbi:DsbE family thiol:disulfide interchange protein [Rhizobium hidalgonense]|uniref:DsbE family thiol:disulfide interchange protein n=1 Tax=Rhizobium hidalgonense TaxID=1538159 RepID=UPI002871816F|nr:DsbE family thiol:disulfide interchange protein [Rhizobium hidalgonense]MDR9808759.1 DsbE family thiol:disulfide interchange protein [Rhizobium hidalgonense]